MAKELENKESANPENPTFGTIAKYSSIEAGLSELKKRHEGVVVDVSTAKGMKAAKEGRAEIRDIRIKLEKMRVEEKAESLAYGKRVDAEAARIKSILEPMELSYDMAIKAEETKKEQEALAIVREQERVKAEEAAKIQAEKDRIAAEERRVFEEAQAKLKAEQEAFEKIQAEAKANQLRAEEAIRLAKVKLEQEEAERRAKIAAEELASIEKQVAAEKEAARIIQEKNEAHAKAMEEARLKRQSELDAIAEKERAEKLKLQKIEDDKKAKALAVEREKQAKAQLKMDGHALLKSFIDRYGKIEGFGNISEKITLFLKGEL